MSGLDRDDIIRSFLNLHPDTPLDGDNRYAIRLGTISRMLEANAAAEREACAKVCHDKAWELKERSIKETVKTQRARLASEAAGWHDAFTAIRARGNDAT